MRLVTYDPGDGPRLGVIRDDTVVDVRALGGSEWGAQGPPTTMIDLIRAGAPALDRLRSQIARQSGEGSSASAATPLARVRLLAPLPLPVRNVFCVGYNYADHVAEGASSGREQKLPEAPIFFTKAT